jgi:GNAT superfamily N-acetyltransferase
VNHALATDLRDHHVTIFLPAEIAGPIEAVRRRWDPAMAAQIAAHVTLVYPREAPAAGLLVERLRQASPATPPFRLRLGDLGHDGGPDGAYLRVEDLDGGYAALRGRVLGPPFQPEAFPAHLTLLHPRTSRQAREFRDARRDWPHRAEFTVLEVVLTAFDGSGWVVVERFALGRAIRPTRIERWRELPVEAVGALVSESEKDGLRLVRRLVDDWAGGDNRFDRPGEAFFVALQDGRVIGVCGLNVDPYAGVPRVGRVRHLYVLTAHRRGGVGRSLVEAVVAEAADRFEELRLRTQNPAAARLYERLGFTPCTDAAATSHRRRLTN